MAVDQSLIDEATQAAEAYNLPVDLFLAQIQQESSFNPLADNGTAEGIAQFTPATAQEYGVSDPYDPVQSLWGAAQYDADLVNQTGSYVGMLQDYGTLPSNSDATLTPSQSSLLGMAQELDQEVSLSGSSPNSVTVPFPSQSPGNTTMPPGEGDINVPGPQGEAQGENSLFSSGTQTGGILGGIGGTIENYFVRGIVVALGLILITAGVLMLKGREIALPIRMKP